MEIAETDLSVVPRSEEVGLGWGEDSVIGDYALSGAGNADQRDADSLFDLDEFVDPIKFDLGHYKKEFTPEYARLCPPILRRLKPHFLFYEVFPVIR